MNPNESTQTSTPNRVVYRVSMWITGAMGVRSRMCFIYYTQNRTPHLSSGYLLNGWLQHNAGMENGLPVPYGYGRLPRSNGGFLESRGAMARAFCSFQTAPSAPKAILERYARLAVTDKGQDNVTVFRGDASLCTFFCSTFISPVTTAETRQNDCLLFHRDNDKPHKGTLSTLRSE
ncbi:unnamed protein product [[Candida] boidinii]|uniref:Unnamed protein product n=1 Tax=Candida boidinii TaxID=5477 RepID=A0A9W6WDF8_CANBO|nr:unnamed protein product [[Candida] boidinii]